MIKRKDEPIDINDKWPKCYLDNNWCDPNIIFGLSEYNKSKNRDCKNCKYLMVNYNKIVDDSIRRAKQDTKDNNYKLITKEVKRDGGKWISFNSKDKGFLIGATTTIEDYYWIYMNQDRKICFSSCVGKYDLLDETNLPPELSVLYYARKYDKESIKQIIDEYISNMRFDKMITDIYY